MNPIQTSVDVPDNLMGGYQLLNLEFNDQNSQLKMECGRSQAPFLIRYCLSSHLTLALFPLLCDES